MKSLPRHVLLLILVIAVMMPLPAARAQTPEGFARILLPIVATNVNGLFGSWCR